MGNCLTWDKRYNVGVDIIDREHKKLFSILNKLYSLGHKEEKSHFACQEAIKYFKDHAIQHFADEEAYMTSIDYPGLEAHKRIHKDFRERMLPALENELELTRFSEVSIQHFIGVCAGWLIGHTLIEDHMIVSGESVRHWEKLLPEEEQAVMGQTIASILHSMFRLDSQLISNCYSGEKFGEVICCHLIYRGRDRKEWDFFLVFEKQLIGSTIGNVIDKKSESTDTMLSNVAKYAAEQLVERVKRNFSSLEQFELINEHLLSYEQFYHLYERLSPQFSLLFDVGRGYLAYCMAASETSIRRDGISAVTENGVAEIKNHMRLSNFLTGKEEQSLSGYGAEKENPLHVENSSERDKHLYSGSEDKSIEHLRYDNASETVANRKKKILVVDDSDFLRTAMLHLLSSDYEVKTADSGMSAIRSITLDQPDLVLLDYEMPVCNGSQVLEMIRSEKDFTDIPVIFLTSKVDRESVKKVISLKPEGYLSKSISADAVKKEIDDFFEKK